MLSRLTVRDFVIVEHAELEFAGGFSALTGETGAGKSILIDALSLVLGERGEAQCVRAGAKQTDLTAEFELAQAHPIWRWLTDNAFEADPGVCLLRRVIDATGRSRAFINGHAATVAQLREAGEMLVDIHGQHAHQSLLRPVSQRELLDAFAGAKALASEVAEAHRAWTDLVGRHAAAARDVQALQNEREQLNWRAQELAQLEFDPDTWQDLIAEHGRLTHAASLIETVSECIEAISDGERAAASLINHAIARIERACDQDPSLRTVLDVLDPAQIQLTEATSALERYRLKLEVDPQRLAAVDQRIQAVHDACRKHRLTTETLADALGAAKARLAELEHNLDLSRLEREVRNAQTTYLEAAKRLSAARTAAARNLAAQVTTTLQDLALAGGTFSVALEQLPEPAAYGLERVEFRVAAHTGQEPGPLGKVASGGELSRISLAMQTVLSRVAQVPTLIFDEVDAGIGGRVAEVVGQMLRRLGERHQVMCVTHLPQVAACANHHWSVAKLEDGGKVASRVDRLEGERRVQEIARMLGGIKISRATLDHAAEMLRTASRRR